MSCLFLFSHSQAHLLSKYFHRNMKLLQKLKSCLLTGTSIITCLWLVNWASDCPRHVGWLFSAWCDSPVKLTGRRSEGNLQSGCWWENSRNTVSAARWRSRWACNTCGTNYSTSRLLRIHYKVKVFKNQIFQPINYEKLAKDRFLLISPKAYLQIFFNQIVHFLPATKMCGNTNIY